VHHLVYIYVDCREFINLLSDIADSKVSVSERNQYFIVEVIRTLAEYVVFGEKLGKHHMDTLIERKTLSHLTRILMLNNRCINLQLLQTTSIMLANIKSTEKKCKSPLINTSDYILSHPFLHELISFKFNYYDEEIVDQLISFLKSLALSLDATTIKFFTNEKHSNFPLLYVTQRFYNHPETMVRNAAHIILLTIWKLNDQAINQAL
jgi:hypothetical protein